MPVYRTRISGSQLAELLGLDPAHFVAVERRCGHVGRGEVGGWYLVTDVSVTPLPGTACSDCNPITGVRCEACAARGRQGVAITDGHHGCGRCRRAEHSSS